jgi:hypothetical protein
MKLSEIVREVIRLGDASRAYWDNELPKHHPRYPIIRAGETPPAPPPEDAQLQALLESLPEKQLYAVMALTLVGRGDFSADQLPGAYQDIKDAFPSKDLATAQLMGTSAIAEYLTDAMEELQKYRIVLDSLDFASMVPAN